MTDERRTITVLPVGSAPYTEVVVDVAIAALAEFGYIVISLDELPEITGDATSRPKLPSSWGEGASTGDNRAERYRSEALGKLALALWWEKEAVRVEKRRDDLLADVRAVPDLGSLGAAGRIATHLVERGWRK